MSTTWGSKSSASHPRIPSLRSDDVISAHRSKWRMANSLHRQARAEVCPQFVRESVLSKIPR